MSIKVIVDGLYKDSQNNRTIKIVDVAEQTYDENEHIVIYYYFDDWINQKIPKLLTIKKNDFESNPRFIYEGMLNELTDAKTSLQVKNELNAILNDYIKYEFEKHEHERNSDLLNMGYDISTLMVEWILK
ncbi:hypothetical protein [Bacillus xiapuensis]|uniref:Uncharacterized protein n=1 Tax=Bacillus xiapuensis TaxID=2014075 RepID=A0ABU6NAU0_9BACI|nr:hypothetical protein [Bacillus xiapuensis]